MKRILVLGSEFVEVQGFTRHGIKRIAWKHLESGLIGFSVYGIRQLRTWLMSKDGEQSISLEIKQRDKIGH